MGCGRCGAQLEDGDLFCGDCGAPVGGACPTCGEPLTPGKRFCRRCGAALFEAAPAPEPVSPPGRESAAERRMCSVLFCDVVGFTPLSEARDPEAVRELLSQYFGVARTVIGRYGGVVEKFIGDAVMAVWGTPVATEGDAERAVRAALDLLTSVAELGAESGLPGLAARAGVVTGEVAVNLRAVGEGMVAGDAVNTASRVQATAEPGSVLVDVPTQRLAGSAIAFADAGEHTLKGKAEPQRLWRAVRVMSAVGGSQRVDGLEAPLTGRDAELRTIKDLFHAAAERRVPRLVLVSGPAGVGKSRLGWEFEKYADGLKADVWWHRGRCLSYGEGVAFWALAQIVRQRLGIAEEDSGDVAAAKLAAGLDRFVPDPAEHAYAGLRLGRLLGVAFAGDSFAEDSGEALSREELFAGWRLFFERLAAENPVILLVEDAQYADAGLLDFLDHLIDWVRDLPVYVLVFARPELARARPGFGAGRNRSTLTLDPLDAASMDLLVDALVPGMPPAARAKITRQAQGIPLFAVETVRSLIDRDVVQPVGGVYRLTGDVGELAVPDSLHALLAARLDALDPSARRLVADAAVLGTTFPAEALIAVSERDGPSVRAALADLVRREVLSVSADPLSPERGSYRFSQEMLRQVAYDTLSRRDRKARHLAVAAHLRTAFPGDGEEVADVVARHYLDALNAIPDDPDAAQIRGQAVAALTRAAERAERTGAPAQAAASFAAAAELSPPGTADGAVAALWERAAHAAWANASYPVSVKYAEYARGHYLGHGQDRAAARVQALAGRALSTWGRHAEAREQLTAALEVLREGPDTDTVSALSRLALLEVFVGSPDADRLSAESLSLGQALGVGPGQLAELLVTRGLYHLLAERRPQAISYFRESARLAAQVGDNGSVGRALLNLADALMPTDPAAAAEAGRTAAGHLRRTGQRRHLAAAIMNVTEALLQIGDWDAAEAEFAQAVDSDALADMEDVTCERGWLAALRGDAGTAEAMRTALRIYRSSEDPQDQAVTGLLEAFAAAARRQPPDALRHARAILAHAEALGISALPLRWAWPLAARCAYELADTATVRELLALLDSYQPGYLAPMLRAERDLTRARLAAGEGDGAAAALFTAAINGLRELSTPYHLAHGLLDHAEYLLATGDAGLAGDARLAGDAGPARDLRAAGDAGLAGDLRAAAAAVAEARAIAGRLRCQPLLDRAAALTPRVSATATPQDPPRVTRLPLRSRVPSLYGAPMHNVDPTTESMIRSVLAYAENRLRLNPVPLDRGSRDPAELDAALKGLLGPGPHNPDQVLGVYTSVIAPAVISADSPRFLGFIPAAPTKASLLFDMLISCASIQGISWLEAAGAIHAENQVLRLIADRAGLPDSAGGCFVSGGSAANLSALVVAREVAKRKAGPAAAGRRWRVAVSEDAHSSITNALRILEMDPLIVRADDHRLTGVGLRAAIAADGDPRSLAAVVATSGTTNAGIIDDLAGVAEVAREHGLWFHVDGAYGGAGLFAPSIRRRYDGIEHADSFIVDPHKWLFAPFDCAALLYRNPSVARSVHKQDASYLDVIHDTPGEWNPTDYAYHLTRRARGLPLWFSLAVYGVDAYAEAIETAIELAHQTAAEIRSRDHLELIREPQLGVVLFRRCGWDSAQYTRWADQLLSDQVAFIPPSAWEGETVARFAFLHPHTSMALVRQILDRMA